MLVGISKESNNDADLCVVSADANTVGCSTSTTERECVRVTKDGDYFISVSEFTSSSVYNLRIAAPGQAATCTTTASASSSFVANQLLAIPKRVDAKQSLGREAGTTARPTLGAQPLPMQEMRRGALAKLRAAGVVVHEAPSDDVAPIDLIRLPESANARAKALEQLRSGNDADQMRRRMAASKAVASPSATSNTNAEAVADAIQLFMLAKEISSSGAYESVEPNWVMETLGALIGAFPPPDRLFPAQRWHYEQIRLPEALQVLASLPQQPSRRPIVAVIDSGVMLDHPDLQSQLFSQGRTFLTSVVPGDGDLLGGDEGARTSRDSFHGTHVAGTIGASSFDTGGNSFGVGVAPMALIMPLRVFPVGRGANGLDIIEALKYAAGLSNRTGRVPQTRADVINLSLGSSQACPAAYQTTFNAVRSAGVLIVAAAGNESNNRTGVISPIGSPANCNGVFAVTATDALRGIAPYSNTGSQAAFAAPGGDMTTSTTGLGIVDGVYSTLGAFNSQGVRIPHFGPSQGTSMAAPHVAGVLALMRYVNPSITPDQVLSRLQAGALTDDLGASGKDSVFGWGLINARKAVAEAISVGQGGSTAPAPTQVVASPSSLDFGAQRSEVQLILRGSNGVSTDQITSFNSPNASVLTIRPISVDALGQGEYTLGLVRSALPTDTKSYFTTVFVTFQSGRVLEVPVSYSVIAASSSIAQAHVGAVYVLLIDPDTGDVEKSVLARYANGRYTWSATGYTKPRVVVTAGTDLDSDDFVCQVGEVCGGFPVFSTTETMTIPLTANRSDLSFTIAPLGGLTRAASMGEPVPSVLMNRSKHVRTKDANRDSTR
ncbi:MAG: S8 family serine peptidase [Burkholderiales bacterium]